MLALGLENNQSLTQWWPRTSIMANNQNTGVLLWNCGVALVSASCRRQGCSVMELPRMRRSRRARVEERLKTDIALKRVSSHLHNLKTSK